MWLGLLVSLLMAAAIHARLRHRNDPRGTAELSLVYLLAGYCGVPQVVLGIAILIVGGPVFMHMGFKSDQPLFMWISFLLIGAGTVATLTIWKRGPYLLAPVVLWSIFFAGATFAHLHMDRANGFPPTLFSVTWIFSTHGLISLLLIGCFRVLAADESRTPS